VSLNNSSREIYSSKIKSLFPTISINVRQAFHQLVNDVERATIGAELLTLNLPNPMFAEKAICYPTVINLCHADGDLPQSMLCAQR
jgi:hypothetical protein